MFCGVETCPMREQTALLETRMQHILWDYASPETNLLKCTRDKKNNIVQLKRWPPSEGL